jgi:sec-independent protein translocase protein TatA
MVADTSFPSTRWYRALMPFGISIPELLILLVVLLLVFGAKRLPEMGRSIGKGMREFKDAVTGVEDDTTPTPPPPAELPAATSERSAPEHDEEPAAESEREAVR